MGTDSRRAEVALRLLQAGAILCILAAAPWARFDLDRHSVPKELVLELTGFGAALWLLARAKRISVSLADAALAAYLVLSLVSALLAPNWWLATRALAISVSGALVFWTARALARAGHARTITATLAASAVLCAVIALAQAYGVHSPYFAERRAPGGTFGNRNFVAHFVALGVPLLILAALEARRYAGAVVAAVGTGLVAGLLVLTRSRAAWLGGAAALVVFAVEGIWIGRLGQDRGTRRRLFTLAGAAVAAAVLALVLPNTLEWRSESPYLDSLKDVANYKEGSGRGRLIQYQNTLKMALDHPLVGVGPGNWPVVYPKYTFPGDPAFDSDDFIPTNPWPSSDWMAFLSERGLPAFACLLLAGTALAIGAWRRWRAAPETSEGLESLAGLLLLVVLGVVSSFDAVLLLPAPTLFVWAALGALMQPAPRPVVQRTLSDTARRRLVAGLAAAGLVFAVRSTNQLVAMGIYDGATKPATLEWATLIDPGSYRMHMLLGFAARERGRCDQVRLHGEAARGLFPNHSAPKRLLAACRARRR
ncbi:MAG TPA: O-antigen ligase family protein [Gemmatimonadales bacterium]|nr:O-antigen ligase family protein [Gemmatimonadales bacterium]